jgi:hypothetical protein
MRTTCKKSLRIKLINVCELSIKVIKDVCDEEQVVDEDDV